MKCSCAWLFAIACAGSSLLAQTPGTGKQVFDTRCDDPPVWILRAIDINTGKITWELPQIGSGESRSGTLATAADLVSLARTAER